MYNDLFWHSCWAYGFYNLEWIFDAPNVIFLVVNISWKVLHHNSRSWNTVRAFNTYQFWCYDYFSSTWFFCQTFYASWWLNYSLIQTSQETLGTYALHHMNNAKRVSPLLLRPEESEGVFSPPVSLYFYDKKFTLVQLSSIDVAESGIQGKLKKRSNQSKH